MKRAMVFLLCAVLLSNIPSALSESVTAESIYLRAFDLFSKGDIEQAAKIFEVLELYKDAAEHARYCRAILAGKEGDFGKAIDLFSAPGSLYDSKEYASYYKGRIQEAKGNSQEALAFYLAAPYIDEVNLYLHSDSERLIWPTKYALDKKVRVYGKEGKYWWWLRSPGDQQARAACISPDGSVDEVGNGIQTKGGFIRPAIWVDLNALPK